MKPRKCQLGMSKCVYLGHIVGGGQVEVEAAKVQAIREFCILRTKKEVRSFLGLTGYYRKFIPNYSSVTSPLTDLTRKCMPNLVVWSPECAAAFEKLKCLLCSAPVLQTPNFEKQQIWLIDSYNYPMVKHLLELLLDLLTVCMRQLVRGQSYRGCISGVG